MKKPFICLVLLSSFYLPWYYLEASPPQKSQKNLKREMKRGRPVYQKTPKNEVQLTLDDPLLTQRWDIEKIQAQKAWTLSQGSKDITVAVIDTGADIKHPDLKQNIWINSKEGLKPDGVDNDKNGYVDDIHGWDFTADKYSERDPCGPSFKKACVGGHIIEDRHGHGTHIAGLIGAKGGNGIGISGIAPHVSLMILKYYDPYDTGDQNLKNTIRAIQYAVQNGADIINYSGGGQDPNPEEKKALSEADKKGILFVTAGGNEGGDLNQNQSFGKEESYYPTMYNLSNILAVSNSDQSDKHHSSSNRDSTPGDKNAIDTTTGGVRLLSTLPHGGYGHLTGTSQSTAVVTGAAVLSMAWYRKQNPPPGNLKQKNSYKVAMARRVKKCLKMTGQKSKNLEGETRYGYRLNIYNCLGPMKSHELNFRDQIVKSPSHCEPGNKNMNQKCTPLQTDLRELEVFNRQIHPSKKPPGKTPKPSASLSGKTRSPASLSPPLKHSRKSKNPVHKVSLPTLL